MRRSNETITEYNKRCGKRLRECREAKKLTQEQLAQIVGYCTQQISNYERGTRGFKSSVRDLSKALDVPVEYLLCETDYKTIEEQWMDEYSDFITTDNLLIEFLKHLGNSIYRQTHTNDKNIMEGTNEEKIFLNGVELERLVFQHMLDDIIEQINYIIKSPQKYSERRFIYLGEYKSREYEREEKSKTS